MYCTPTETPKARKPHRCMSCGEKIEVGEKYIRWRCYDDGASTNKMHVECYQMHCDDAETGGGSWEYCPFSYERPTHGANG